MDTVPVPAMAAMAVTVAQPQVRNFIYPADIKVDSTGNLFIADFQNNRVQSHSQHRHHKQRRVGTGDTGGALDFGGDGGAATSAAICYPMGLLFDTSGNLYVAEHRREQSSKSHRSPAFLRRPRRQQPDIQHFCRNLSRARKWSPITDSTPGAVVYLTLDGSLPNTGMYAYNGTCRRIEFGHDQSHCGCAGISDE